MDDIEDFKKFLGPIAKDYNDAQLHRLRREMDALAELLLDIYIDKHRKSRNRTAKSLTAPESLGTIPGNPLTTA